MGVTGGQSSEISLKLLSPQDLSDLLMIPVSTIYQWRYKGTGPQARRLGKHLRYRLSDVEEWLEQQT